MRSEFLPRGRRIKPTPEIISSFSNDKKTYKEIARQLGVSDRTLRRWRKEGLPEKRASDKTFRKAVTKVAKGLGIKASEPKGSVNLSGLQTYKRYLVKVQYKITIKLADGKQQTNYPWISFYQTKKDKIEKQINDEIQNIEDKPSTYEIAIVRVIVEGSNK